MSAGRGALCWVVPALDGPISGGTLYNRELCAALRALEQPVVVRALGAADLDSHVAAARYTWVDSLYLAALPGLAVKAPGRVGLLAHYMPSFVKLGRAAAASELASDESLALGAASSFLVTSAFMSEALEPLVATQKPRWVIEPGSSARLATVAHLPLARGLRALIIANLVPGKGIQPFLAALRARLAASDRLELSIIGSASADPEYAARCRALIADAPELALRVTLAGALEPRDAQAWLATAQLLISASRMESYGMALAEARVSGVPLLALSGGNVARHIEPEAGGQLCASDGELADACLALTRAPDQLARRIEQARSSAPPARSWSAAAAALLAQLETLEQ